MVLIVGTKGDDVLEGGAAADLIKGRAGDDTLIGQGGNDRLKAGKGADQLWGGEGDDNMTGGPGNDSIDGGAGADRGQGRGGADSIDGGDGNDVLLGGSGGDQLFGRLGADRLDGGRGDDLLNGGEGNDELRGRGGDDNLQGRGGDDVLDGGPGDDVLNGLGGDDTLSGGSGHDDLIGGAGDDFFDGGRGDDLMRGGEGVDTVIFNGEFADYAIVQQGGDTLVRDDPPDPPAPPDFCFTNPPPDPLPDECSPRARRSDGNDRISGMEVLLFADRSTDGKALNGFPITDPDGLLALRGVLEVPLASPPVDLELPLPWDPDGDELSVTAVEVPPLSVGSVLKIDGSVLDAHEVMAPGDLLRLRFEAASGAAAGPASFVYRVDDGRGGSATQQVPIKILVPPPGVLELAYLNGSTGFVIKGVARDDESGVAVDGSGDFNGDGFADLLIGARSADANGGNSGAAYLVYGSAGKFPAVFSLDAINGDNGSILRGAAAGDRVGVAVSGGGDLNGDGLSDALLGARAADPNGSLSGEGYAVLGTASAPTVLELSSLDGGSGFVLQGSAPQDFAGRSIRSAGDVNGDGYGDLIIGAAGADAEAVPSGPADLGLGGRSYVVFGQQDGVAAPRSLDALAVGEGFAILGATRRDQSGFAVDGAGDVNGDGYDDLLVGAYLSDPHGSASGSSYLIFGGPDVGASGPVALSLLGRSGGAAGLEFKGIAAGDQSGRAVAGLGDVNGDGFADLLIAAPQADAAGEDSGESYVVFGDPALGAFPSFNLDGLGGARGFAISGVNPLDAAGFAVSAAGDVNADGYDDILIAARDADPNGDGSGEVYLLYGGDEVGVGGKLDLFSLHFSQGLLLRGVAAGDGAGTSVGDVGDFNGDGYDDVIIGALGADPGGARDAGESYLVFGFDSLGRVTHQGGPGDDVLSGSGELAAADVMVGGLGSDVLLGGRGPDVLYGGAGDDLLAVTGASFLLIDGGGSFDTLRLDGESTVLDLTAVPAPRLRDIEAIALNGGNSVLLLDALAVLRASSSSNALWIDGLQGSSVLLAGQGWVQSGTRVFNDTAFSVYDNGAAQLLLSETVGVDFSAATAGQAATATAEQVPATAAAMWLPSDFLLPLALLLVASGRLFKTAWGRTAPRRSSAG